MWRIVLYTAINPDTGASFLPNSITSWSMLLSVSPAGARALAAVVALTLRGRADWLRYPQIGLWLLALASAVYIADADAPFTGLRPLPGRGTTASCDPGRFGQVGRCRDSRTRRSPQRPHRGANAAARRTLRTQVQPRRARPRRSRLPACLGARFSPGMGLNAGPAASRRRGDAGTPSAAGYPAAGV